MLRKDMSTHSLRSLDEHPLGSALLDEHRTGSESSAMAKKLLKPVKDATHVVGNKVTQVSHVIAFRVYDWFIEIQCIIDVRNCFMRDCDITLFICT